VFNVGEFFHDEVRFSIWFNDGDGRLFGVTIREVDIVPLLVVFVSNFHGFMDVVIVGFDVISSELDLHTIGFPWPLEDGQGSVSSFVELTEVTIFTESSNS